MITDTFIPCGSHEYITSVPYIMMGLSPEQGHENPFTWAGVVGKRQRDLAKRIKMFLFL